MGYIITISILLLSSITNVCLGQNLPKKDLDEILKKIEHHSIIGLGEAEHFYTGYYRAKIDILKHLIQNESIDVIALEASINVTALLNKYINGDAMLDVPNTLIFLNEPYSLQKAGLYNCVEIVELIDWLKDYNTHHNKKIKLVGIDFQNYSIPLENLKNQATYRQREKISQTKVLLDSSMQAILDSSIMIITSQEWLSLFKRAQSNVKSLKAELGNNENKTLFTELEQFTTLWDNPMFPRDSLMYENLVSHIDEKSRVLIWSANFHLENDKHFKGPKKLGVFLDGKYGNEYFIIGVTDMTNEQDDNLIYPSKADYSLQYNLKINVRKGEKCEMLN
ncbi:erythromycin esterase family protein [Sphingobacterium hungaricum]